MRSSPGCGSRKVVHKRGCRAKHYWSSRDRHGETAFVKLGILPFTARLPIAPLNGFWIFDDALVTFETIAAEIHVRDPDEVALYANVFDRFGQVALYEDEARAIIAAAFHAL